MEPLFGSDPTNEAWTPVTCSKVMRCSVELAGTDNEWLAWIAAKRTNVKGSIMADISKMNDASFDLL